MIFKTTLIGALGALAFETTQASTTIVSEYDIKNEMSTNTLVSASISDLTSSDIPALINSLGFNSGMAYSVTPTMDEDEAVTTLTIPKLLGGDYYLEWVNGSNEDIGLNMVINEGDNLWMSFTNAQLSFNDGDTLQFNIYSTLNGGVEDLNLTQNLDITTKDTYVAYANGERQWVGDAWGPFSGHNVVQSSEGYVTFEGSESLGGTSLPEPSSILFVTMATLPLVLRRKRS